MTDVLTREQRHRNMSHIRSRDTTPEMIIRRGLHARGFRFRLQDRRLPGRPDLVLKRYQAVIFVHGCFWHGHDCPIFRLPETRRDYWVGKINSNRNRDIRVMEALLKSGWRVAIVWECSLRGRARLDGETPVERCAQFLRSDDRLIEIRGKSS